ncbi:MAG: hypothetical protein QM768_12710 [Agriterribacter sp.]
MVLKTALKDTIKPSKDPPVLYFCGQLKDNHPAIQQAQKLLQ